MDRMPMPKMPPASREPALPGPVARMDEECQQVYRDVLNECMDSGAEEKRCMAIAYNAAAEHEEGYADTEDEEMTEDDEESL